MPTKYVHFTDEQKEQARQTDLCELLRSQGETLKRSGSEYEWKDGSQKVTIRGNLWFHQYDRQGGDAIDFVKRFYNKEYPEAVSYLLGSRNGTLSVSPSIERKPSKPFELPPRNENMRRVYAAVQELQKSRQKNAGGKKAVYPLTGMLRCPDCGRTYRRQLVRGKAYWICSGKASGATTCSSRRMAEPDVYEAFNRMFFKLKEHRPMLLGTLIRDIETMQSKMSENHEKIVEIDKEIADLAARNLVIARLHTSGILNGSDYSAQSSEINDRISTLRSERRKKLAEDEGDEQLDKLKELQGILDEYEPTAAFNEDLFNQIVETTTVMSRSEIVFQLIGGLKLTESIA